MHNRLMKNFFIFLSLIATTSASDVDKPNIVLIMADDLGYYDLSCYGHPNIKTPVLDNMAKEGARLLSFYSGNTVCTPSRMGLLSGSYPSRLGWTQGVIGYKISTKQGMSPKVVTMAEVFKENGYKTAICGKWHLGDLEKFLPQSQGFEHSYFIKKSNNQSRKLYRNKELLENPFENRLLTEKFTNEAKSFIKQNKDNPFFLYIPYTAPHFPVEAHPDWKGKSDFGEYGDVVEEMDSRIGEIFQVINESDLDKKTIVIFMSDNGPQGGEKSQSIPFRGKKWSALEGGNRVPCIVRWPEVVPAGTEINKMVASIDFFPTLTHICGINLPKEFPDGQVIDGVNVWGTFTSQKNFNHPRNELLLWHGMNGLHAIRRGKWKLFIDPKGTQLKDLKEPVALFNLEDEKNEMTDLSLKHPEKVQELKKLAEEIKRKINAKKIELGQ